MQVAISATVSGRRRTPGAAQRSRDLAKVLAELLVELLFLASDRLRRPGRRRETAGRRDDSGRPAARRGPARRGPRCRSRRPIPRAARRSGP